ncbi:MAG: hypothetical protein MZV70_01225 [Desulfobacterales bacterium]|nr:hypothetical protein [Desulfobacterales bacterium]
MSLIETTAPEFLEIDGDETEAEVPETTGHFPPDRTIEEPPDIGARCFDAGRIAATPHPEFEETERPDDVFGSSDFQEGTAGNRRPVRYSRRKTGRGRFRPCRQAHIA